ETQAMNVGVAGAGVIGLSCAYELLRRGHEVTVFDARPVTASTSWAAAGMLGPAYEMFLHPDHEVSGLAALCFESAALWAEFSERVHCDSGLPVGYRREPTLALAQSAEETRALQALKAVLGERGARAAWLDVPRARNQFGLSPDVQAVLQLDGDHQVDNRKLLMALRSAVLALGGCLIRQDVTTLVDARQKSGNGLDTLVWARGRREEAVTSCVKGQALSLERQPGMPDHVVRFGSAYVVPKADRVIIGATSEADYAHTGVDQTTIEQLYMRACSVLPKLSSAERLEAWSGLRPKSEDGLPVLKRLNDQEFVAAGHFRHGILLAPITARAIADLVEGKTPVGA
ncbi:MAG: FAD-dependent oxidoreductase, partial [Henriciella sp.]